MTLWHPHPTTPGGMALRRERDRVEAFAETMRSALLSIFVLGCGVALGIALVLWAGPGRGPGRLSRAGEGLAERPDFAPIVEQVLPGVVSIDVEKRFRHRDFGLGMDEIPDELGPGFPGEEFEIPSSGSGFVMDGDGHIITNDHVVRDAVRIHVHMSSGRTLEARLVGRDPMTDVAVLQVPDDDPLPAVPLGDSDEVRIGDWVIAIGNPLGMLEGSVTAGIVSGKGRSDLAIRGGSPAYQDFIQTDASINPGNSGGPLVNRRGEAIGVSAAYNAPGNGIGFAIAINMVRQVADQLIRTGRVPRAFLGVNLMTLDDELARGWGLDHAHGVVVTEVQPETPAADAGLREGDVIIEYDGVPVSQVSPFRLLVARSQVGRKVGIRFLRAGRPHQVDVKLAERSDPVPAMPGPVDSSPQEDLGLFLSPLEPGDEDVGGVQVDSVRTDSPAFRAGIREGDAVLEVGWKPVRSLASFRHDVRRDMEERGVVVLRVQRGDSRSFIAIPAH